MSAKQSKRQKNLHYPKFLRHRNIYQQSHSAKSSPDTPALVRFKVHHYNSLPSANLNTYPALPLDLPLPI